MKIKHQGMTQLGIVESLYANEDQASGHDPAGYSSAPKASSNHVCGEETLQLDLQAVAAIKPAEGSLEKEQDHLSHQEEELNTQTVAASTTVSRLPPETHVIGQQQVHEERADDKHTHKEGGIILEHPPQPKSMESSDGTLLVKDGGEAADLSHRPADGEKPIQEETTTSLSSLVQTSKSDGQHSENNKGPETSSENEYEEEESGDEYVVQKDDMYIPSSSQRKLARKPGWSSYPTSPYATRARSKKFLEARLSDSP